MKHSRPARLGEKLMRSGRLVDLAHPRPDDVDLDDIAHGLAHLCRFDGQCEHFYSVAQHSVLVSRLCEMHADWALFHDAHEAYLGDVSSPLKALLGPEYRRLSEKWDIAIAARFGLRRAMKSVKRADTIAMLAEVRDNGPFGLEPAHFLGYADLPESVLGEVEKTAVNPLAPGAAEALFLARVRELRIAT